MFSIQQSPLNQTRGTVCVCVFLTGAASGAAHQGLAAAGGICLQDLRAGEETWKSHNIHHVLTNHQFFHIYAVILFLM